MVVRQSQNMSWDFFQLDLEDEPVADEAADHVVRMSRKSKSSKMLDISFQKSEYICLNC